MFLDQKHSPQTLRWFSPYLTNFTHGASAVFGKILAKHFRAIWSGLSRLPCFGDRTRYRNNDETDESGGKAASHI